MAMYRNVMMGFWTDRKVADEFTPEDRYFYLYLFTNPHTNLCGCYEISMKQTIAETGYSRESIENLIKRFETVHDVIRYSSETGEVLVLNWHKYNWTTSDKFRKPLLEQIQSVKCQEFKKYLMSVFESGKNTVSIPYQYPTNTTVVVTDTDTDTVSITDRCSSNKGGVDFLELLTCEEIAYLKTLYIDAYDLIDEVSDDATKKRKTISNPLSYVIGYATNKGWPENEQQTQR